MQFSLFAGFEIDGAVMTSASWLVILNNPPGDEAVDGPSFMVIIAAHIIHVFITLVISPFLNGMKWCRSTNFIRVVLNYTE